MNTIDQETLQRLTIIYLEGNASDEERLLLENWICMSDENRKQYQHLKNLWEVSDHRNDAYHISTENAFDRVLEEISEKPRKRSFMNIFGRVAAILIFPLALSGYLVGKNMASISGGSSVVYNEIYASLGTRSTIFLPDGSRVWLNSGSKLRYPDKFTAKTRLVYLTGEAYFEVNSNESMPFVVQTEQISIKATGTKFNVQALGSEQEVRVSLVSGIVAVNKGHNGEVEQTLTQLSPNEMFSYNLTTGASQTFSGDLYEFIAWKDGRLVFRNKPLSEVVRKISQHYNVDIELRGKELQDYRYRATFEEESINEILKLLQMSSPIKYYEVKRKPLANGTFSERKIIITPL
ncbi:MAG TPA: FecR domain-containing protein [Bacteroidales bacterium]|nr:FecR domain-containing protein [Bacteroidales bacterium]